MECSLCPEVSLDPFGHHAVTSPICPAILGKASQAVGAAALGAESCKHMANDQKCQELGWVFVPIAVETYGNWDERLRTLFFPHLASHLSWLLVLPNPSPK
eukprot:Em0018g682a